MRIFITFGDFLRSSFFFNVNFELCKYVIYVYSYYNILLSTPVDRGQNTDKIFKKASKVINHL